MLYMADFLTASEKLNFHNVAEVESIASLLAMPRCSNVLEKHRTSKTQCGDRK